ncbi:type II toxin-antitoxin system HicB family antitoxin [Wohlfahrtiimonas chitiniclastica]|uniref:type II toxin-antitoxin system HicB family antitoxin n=1 Tax=Wohlfahrtiimonas chitiniclastica TaxID=400946 RepID=UPI001BCBF3B3|nr:type II toxin-antitoxin system HicB family antitoxin [Wohlfahrtiimonas chitiniclastica]MBS7826464.1 type II toxin-antitoxin system HicB family antitoxin [Wohlfahrtiimonas chitiniclastica]
MLFHLVVHKDNDSAYGVTVPALEGCFSAGDTLEEAVANSKEAILFHLEGLLEDGLEPAVLNPTLDELRTNPDYQDGFLVSVDIDISQYTLKPERFNVSWSKNILRQVDMYVAKTHDNRSNFLAKAAIEYMQK